MAHLRCAAIGPKRSWWQHANMQFAPPIRSETLVCWGVIADSVHSGVLYQCGLDSCSVWSFECVEIAMPGPLMLHKFLTIALAVMLLFSFAAVSKSSGLQDADYAGATNLVSKGDCQRAWELIRDSIVTQPAVLNKFVTFAFSKGFRVYPAMKNELDFAKFLIAVSITSFEELDVGALQVVDATLYSIIDEETRISFIDCENQGRSCREAAFFSLRRQPVGEYLKEFVRSMLDEDSYGFCPSGLGIRRMQ
jgi:hypothetical protein